MGERILAGEIDLIESDREYDWLGPGAYFWENDPVRAKEWAEAKVRQKRYDEAFVVGAVIDLGHCLDLLVRENIPLLRLAYADLVARCDAVGSEMPRNGDLPHDAHRDKLLRKLDCAVIRTLHDIVASTADDGPDRVLPFDTVRGVFTEGAAVYPGSGFHELTHTQIAVRTATSIKGLFRPRGPDDRRPAAQERAGGEDPSGAVGGPRAVMLGGLRVTL